MPMTGILQLMMSARTDHLERMQAADGAVG